MLIKIKTMEIKMITSLMQFMIITIISTIIKIILTTIMTFNKMIKEDMLMIINSNNNSNKALMMDRMAVIIQNTMM